MRRKTVKPRSADFFIETMIEQDGFRAGIVSVDEFGRTTYWLERPDTEIRVNKAPSTWDARRRIRGWISAHYPKERT